MSAELGLRNASSKLSVYAAANTLLGFTLVFSRYFF